MNYCVKLDFDAPMGFELPSNPDEDADGNPIWPRYKVFALSDTWMTENAWKMGFETFLNNSAEENHRVARWNDFRVKHGWEAGTLAEGWPATFAGGQNLNPTLLQSGEFIFSEVRTELGGAFNFTFGRQAAGNFSLYEEYDKKSSPEITPSIVETDMPYAELDEDTQIDQSEHLQDAGNLPPYNLYGLNQPNIWRQVADLAVTSDGTTQSTGYFNAPCGFVVVVGYYETIDTALATPLMELTVKPGKYKGVHAEPMGVAKKLGKMKFKVE
jgi:hypothetical protein